MEVKALSPPEQPRQKIPKDGFGPRGVPDCYYTSRVLDSTDRYVRFVKKLRHTEEDERVSTMNKRKIQRDTQILNFFAGCDRKNLINKVQRRVNLCLEAYEDSVADRRARLLVLLEEDEKANIKTFAEQAQAGAEAVYKDKMDLLARLLAKRKKEHEDKYKAVPLSKSSHVQPCLFKMRAKEAGEIQLYQMREKQMRKMAEAEFDHMWHEVSMKESEALAARMEQDVIENLRRSLECQKYSDALLEQRRQQRMRDQERLRQEVREMKARMEADDRQEQEKQRKLKEERDATVRERKAQFAKHKEEVIKIKAENKLINDTWDSLTGQVLADDKADMERRRQMQRELNLCNKKMLEMKNRLTVDKFDSDPMIMQEGQRIRDIADLQRCLYRKEDKRQKLINQKNILQQIKEKQDDVIESIKRKERDEYQSQVLAQLDQLVQHKQMTDAQVRKLRQKDLSDQIEYNNLRKEREKQEELDQRKKCQIARDEYQESIKTMLSRPFLSDEIHPFMKQMARGVKIGHTRGDYCIPSDCKCKD